MTLLIATFVVMCAAGIAVFINDKLPGGDLPDEFFHHNDDNSHH